MWKYKKVTSCGPIIVNKQDDVQSGARSFCAVFKICGSGDVWLQFDTYTEVNEHNIFLHAFHLQNCKFLVAKLLYESMGMSVFLQPINVSF